MWLMWKFERVWPESDALRKPSDVEIEVAHYISEVHWPEQGSTRFWEKRRGGFWSRRREGWKVLERLDLSLSYLFTNTDARSLRRKEGSTADELFKIR